ncbi:GNAT family N-acetyltransferase [Vibrio sp.]|uniref:GNAT family N-acetyltransferase n=1 Tax=Vibrio sp. TaxID=678 RepID=UPI003D0E5433
MTHSIIHEPDQHRYLVHLQDGMYAQVIYRQQDQVLLLTSTHVPDSLQGKGYGGIMMETVLPQIEADGFKITPVCSYVVHYLDKHPEWAHLVA